MFDELGISIKELGQLDPNDFTDVELAEPVVELDMLHAMFTAAEARLARAFNVRQLWAADGAKSAAA